MTKRLPRHHKEVSLTIALLLGRVGMEGLLRGWHRTLCANMVASWAGKPLPNPLLYTVARKVKVDLLLATFEAHFVQLNPPVIEGVSDAAAMP